jgi:hypothetical protein
MATRRVVATWSDGEQEEIVLPKTRTLRQRLRIKAYLARRARRPVSEEQIRDVAAWLPRHIDVTAAETRALFEESKNLDALPPPDLVALRAVLRVLRVLLNVNPPLAPSEVEVLVRKNLAGPRGRNLQPPARGLPTHVSKAAALHLRTAARQGVRLEYALGALKTLTPRPRGRSHARTFPAPYAPRTHPLHGNPRQGPWNGRTRRAMNAENPLRSSMPSRKPPESSASEPRHCGSTFRSETEFPSC